MKIVLRVVLWAALIFLLYVLIVSMAFNLGWIVS